VIDYLKTIYATLTERKNSLLAIQGISCMLGLGFWIWDVVTFVKDRTLGKIDFKLFPWTYYYFHPVESNLFNYIFLSLSLGLTALMVYLLINKKTSVILNDWINRSHPLVVIVCTVASLTIVYSMVISDSFLMDSILLVILLCLPILSVTYYASRRLRIDNNLTDKGLLILSMLLFFLTMLEPLATFMGPTYLINDYPAIYSKTIVTGSCLDNKEFLQRLEKRHMDTVKIYLAVYDEIDIALRSARNIQKISKENFQLKIHEDELGLFQQFKNRDLNPSQKYFTSLITDPSSEKEWASRFRSLSDATEGIDEDTEDYIGNIKKINMETLKQFYLANYMEYWLQNMGRGQIHHIGHYLNPLNEYELGKPLNSIFVQYGLGSMLLSKWTMDLFGGISIHNFYKTYIYYILYYLLFILMSFALFKDRLYVCAAISILPACFFSLGYIAYILAPGFIPTVHILDAVTLVALMLFLRSGKWLYLGMLALLTMLSIIINGQFGMVLTISLFLSLVLYVLENKQGRYKYLWSFSFCALFITAVAFYKLFSIGALEEIFPYFWLGWLSWPVSGYTISYTIFYLVISYLFIFFLKDHRFYLKYIYIAVFVYAQSLLGYYYWSGVRNHVPTVVPFIWLQFILMLYIAEKYLIRDRLILHNNLRFATRGALFLSIILIIPSANFYYAQKSFFKANFENHKTYTWEFDRANLISTMDPVLMKESIELVKKYSGESKPAIYILSKYDGVIPFLAKKYSAMSFFELTAYIFSEKESNAAIKGINTTKPEYLYIDSNIKDTSYDPWSKVYRSDYTDRERASRINRYLALKNIFMAIEGDYEKIEEGTLISVYKRNPGRFD
jgi:hypothetical protein